MARHCSDQSIGRSVRRLGGRTRPIHPAPFRAPLILHVIIRNAPGPRLWPLDVMGPGNGILRAETGGRLQAQNAGERPEFGSQTAPRPANCSPAGNSIPTISASALSTPLPISKLVCDAAKDMLVDGLKMKTAVIMSEDAAWTTPLDAGYVACLPKIGLNVLDNPLLARHHRFHADLQQDGSNGAVWVYRPHVATMNYLPDSDNSELVLPMKVAKK